MLFGKVEIIFILLACGLKVYFIFASGVVHLYTTQSQNTEMQPSNLINTNNNNDTAARSTAETVFNEQILQYDHLLAIAQISKRQPL